MRRYRISRPRDRGGAVLATGSALTAGTGGVLTGVPVLVVAGALLLTVGPVVVLWHHLRAGNVLVLLPGLVAVDRWPLRWPAVSKIIVFDTAEGQPAMLGVQLRSPDHLPRGIPATHLDQTVPAQPIVLSTVESDRLDVDRLAAVFHRIRPPGVELVHHHGITPADR